MGLSRPGDAKRPSDPLVKPVSDAARATSAGWALLAKMSPLFPALPSTQAGRFCQRSPSIIFRTCPRMKESDPRVKPSCTAVTSLSHLRSSENGVCCSAWMRGPPTPWWDCFHTQTSHIHHCVRTRLYSDTFQLPPREADMAFQTGIRTPGSAMEEPEHTCHLCSSET